MEADKKLSPKQIEYLYDFTRKHYVEHYDLQTEFVQELKSGIEKQWKENPDEEFTRALEKEFKKYGVFGFTEIVEKRRGMLEKKYMKLVLGKMWSFFKSSNLLWIVLLIVGVFTLLNYFKSYNAIIFVASFWILFLLSLIKMYRNGKEYKRRIKQTGKRFLFQEIIYKTGNFYLVFITLLNMVNLITNTSLREADMPSVENIYLQVLMSTILVCFAVLLYLILYRIPKNADRYCNDFYQRDKEIIIV